MPDEIQPPPAPAAPLDDGRRDKFGRPFDPVLHETGKDGRPLLTPKGIIRLKRGRGAHASTLPPPPADDDNDDGAPQLPGNPAEAAPTTTGKPKPTKAEIEAFSAMAVGALLAGLRSVDPDDKLEDAERQSLEGALERIALERGIVSISPEMQLAIAAGAIVASRWQRPKTVTWREKLFGKLFPKKDKHKAANDSAQTGQS